MKGWIANHPNIWEFILFNVLSNVSTAANIRMWNVIWDLNAAFSQALPAYSQTVMADAGIPSGVIPTLANVVNILVQVAISYPAMKFWIMPKEAI